MSETKFEFDKKKLQQFLSNVRQEILNIQSGEAKWRTGPPLHFEVGKAVPIHATLERFQANPTKKTYDDFIAIAHQDLGAPTGKGFATWGQGVFTKIEGDKPAPPPSKKFTAKLFDGFYSIFKVARIQLEPTQIAMFEAATAQLAKTFSEEIHREMKIQLAETVAKVKAADEVLALADTAAANAKAADKLIALADKVKDLGLGAKADEQGSATQPSATEEDTD